MYFDAHIRWVENGEHFTAEVPGYEDRLVEGATHHEALRAIWPAVGQWRQETQNSGHRIDESGWKARLIRVASLPDGTDARQVKQAYRSIFYGLADMLWHLYQFSDDMPEDEFYNESHRIMAGLGEVVSPDDLAELMRRVFEEAFNAKMAGPSEKYSEIAGRIWEMGQSHGILPPSDRKADS